MRQINKVAVLGAGVMGATIAAHLANTGIQVLLLDIVPREPNDAEKAAGLTVADPVVRNRIATAGLDPAKVNVKGGAIALGHPLGCTGAKLIAGILQEMQRSDTRYGIVSMCIGGGMGAAGIFEKM